MIDNDLSITLRNVLASDVARLTGPNPPASLLLRQYGFLLGTAPLDRGLWVAMLDALASLRGIRTCGPRHDPVGRRGYSVCAESGISSVEVVLDPRTGIALATDERLKDTSALFPHVRAGTIVESDTFTQH